MISGRVSAAIGKAGAASAASRRLDTGRGGVIGMESMQAAKSGTEACPRKGPCSGGNFASCDKGLQARKTERDDAEGQCHSGHGRRPLQLWMPDQVRHDGEGPKYSASAARPSAAPTFHRY